MNKSSDDWNKLKHLVDLSAENARLKAEVERLTAEVSYDNRVQLHVDKLAAEFTQSEVERLKAEVERLGEENKTRQKDMELLFASYKQALEDIRRLHWDLRTAKEGKQP